MNHLYYQLPNKGKSKDFSIIKQGDSLEVCIFELEDVPGFFKKIQNLLIRLNVESVKIEYKKTNNFDETYQIFYF